ncbi:MAG: transglycosylase SLT domain-containing protein [Candidatus Andersenbacteria bacterium]
MASSAGVALAVGAVVAVAFAPAVANAGIVQCDPTQGTKLVTCDLCALYAQLQTIINIAAGGLVGFGVLAFVVGGLRYVTSAGNPELIAKAKKTVQFAIAGIIVTTLAFVLIKATTTILGYSKDPFSALSCVLPEPASGGGGTSTPPSPRPGQQPTGPGSTGQWANLINQAAQKYSIEPCALQSIMQAESGGNPNALGHDGHNGTDDPYDASKPPFWNLNWKYSHGIGLMQPTIFPSYRYGGWQDSNTPSCLTPPPTSTPGRRSSRPVSTNPMRRTTPPSAATTAAARPPRSTPPRLTLPGVLIADGVGVVVLVALAAAAPAYAQTSIVQCQPFDDASKLITCDLCELFKMLNNIFSIAAGALVGFGVLAFVVGGLRYVTSAGNPELIAKAKKTVQFAIAGIIVTTLAFVLIKATTTILGYSKDPFSALSCVLPEPASGGGGTSTPPSLAPASSRRDQVRPGKGQPDQPGRAKVQHRALRAAVDHAG